jgi:hypothetical protein
VVLCDVPESVSYRLLLQLTHYVIAIQAASYGNSCGLLVPHCASAADDALMLGYLLLVSTQHAY